MVLTLLTMTMVISKVIFSYATLNIPKGVSQTEPKCLLRPNTEKASCKLGQAYDNIFITNVKESRGSSHTDGDTGSVQHGTTCVWTSETGQIHVLICDAGTWREMNPQETASIVLLRKKKNILDPQTDERRNKFLANQPPKITCPVILSTIFTQKGKVTVAVSWDLATANDPEDGVLGVIQTQGQAPGTLHAEGEHTVSYMARDSQGLIAFCSCSFVVSTVGRCSHNFTYLLHGTVTCQPPEHPNIIGSECSYVCLSGYQLVGNSVLICQDNGTWSENKPVCMGISCGPPGLVEHGTLMCQTDQYIYLSQCMLLCDVGYTSAEQNMLITCQVNGLWSAVNMCKVKLCQNLEAPVNGDIICSHNNTYGSVCTTACQEMYTLEGEANQACQENQTWSGKSPKCIRKCPSPPALPHGYFECPNGHVNQATCSVTCVKGYRPTAPLTITCNTSNQWTEAGSCRDKTAPSFFENCPSDIDLYGKGRQKVSYALPEAIDNSGENVTVVGNPPSGSTFPVGMTTVVIIASDSHGNSVSCQFNVNIKVFTCRDPRTGLSETDPIHFECPEGHIYGAYCNASCKNGNKLQGSQVIECSIYNDSVEWVAKYYVLMPYCQDLCSPGQYSDTGIQPCSNCDACYYQENYGQTSCSSCFYGMCNLERGARSKDTCQPFDLYMHDQLTLPTIRGGSRTFTILTWLHVEASDPRLTLELTLDPNNGQEGCLSLLFANFGVYICFRNNMEVRSVRYWYHVAFVLDLLKGDKGKGTLYVNGKEISSVAFAFVRIPIQEQFSVQFIGSAILFIKNPLTLAGFQMTSSALSHEEIIKYYQSCRAMPDNLLLHVQRHTIYRKPSTCDDIDNCLGDPCGQHGICLDGPGNFSCLCDESWSGKRCQIPMDFCINNMCQNEATCVSHIEYHNYTCLCAEGFSDTFCQRKIVNGGWGAWGEWSACDIACGKGQRFHVKECDSPSPDPLGKTCPVENKQLQPCLGNLCPVAGGFGEWSEWSLCSVTCGGGSSFRSRVCDNPFPDLGGAACDATSERALVNCNTFKCPECPMLSSRPTHESVSCNYTSDRSMKECRVVCKPGLVLFPESPDTFYCGCLTNYSWSHQTVKNPTGILPDCTDQQWPVSATARVDFVYQNFTCNTEPQGANLKSVLLERFLQRLACNTTKDCMYSVSVAFTCDGPPNGSVTIRLKHEEIKSQVVFPALPDKKRNANLIANMLTELNSISKEALDINVGNHKLIADIKVPLASVKCQSGAGMYYGLCVGCPSGTYSTEAGTCDPCEQGLYQDQSKMMSCSPCPTCFTTAGVGSFSEEQCSIHICTEASSGGTNRDSSETQQTIIIIVIAGVCGLFVILFIVQRINRKRVETNVYDIPGQIDENPYSELPSDNYDIIPEDPYDKDLAVSAGGYIQAKDPYPETMTERVVQDYDVSNGNYALATDDVPVMMSQNNFIEAALILSLAGDGKAKVKPPSIRSSYIELISSFSATAEYNHSPDLLGKETDSFKSSAEEKDGKPRAHSYLELTGYDDPYSEPDTCNSDSQTQSSANKQGEIITVLVPPY